MNNLENELKSLVRKIRDIEIKRDTTLIATKGHFNIFTTLLSAHDETRLHSRFITHLLNPRANHSCQRLFLDLFLDVLATGIQPHDDKSSVNQDDLKKRFSELQEEKCLNVRTELCTNKGNIDIYIEFKNHIIAIENKIWAGEQNEQISRYIDFLFSKGKKFTMLYLTLDGKLSETHKDKDYYRISYQNHILKWMELCLKETYKYVNINQALQQYKSVVKGLTGQNMEAEDMNEIKAILKKNPDVIKYQSELNKAINEIKNEQCNIFFNTLIEMFKNYGYRVNSFHKSNKWEIFKVSNNNTCKIPLAIWKEEDFIMIGLYLSICSLETNLNNKIESEKDKLYKLYEENSLNFPGGYDKDWILGTYHVYTENYFFNTLLYNFSNEKKLFRTIDERINSMFDYIKIIQEQLSNL